MQTVGLDKVVVGQRYCRERHAVGRVGDRADRLPQHVHHPVRGLAAGDQGVQRPCRRPHDVGTRLVVFGILDCDQ